MAHTARGADEGENGVTRDADQGEAGSIALARAARGSLDFRCSPPTRLHYLDSAATVAEAARGARRDERLLQARQREPASRRVRAVGARDRALSRGARRSRDSSACSDAACLIFTRGTTESLNLVPRRGDARTLARATRSSSRRSSTTRTSSRGSSSRSRDGATLRICDADGGRPRRPRRSSRRSSAADEGRRVQPRVERARHDESGGGDRSRSRSASARSSCAMARRRRRTCRSTSTRSAWTSTRSAATRCSARWAAACSSAGARCSRRCRRTRSAAT